MRRPPVLPSTRRTARALALLALAALMLFAACGRKGDPHPRSDVHAEAAAPAPAGG